MTSQTILLLGNSRHERVIVHVLQCYIMGLKGLVLVFSNSILMITHEYLCEIWVRFDTMHLVVCSDDDSEEEGRGGCVGHGVAGGEQEEDAARDGAAHPAGGEAAGRVRQGLQVTQEAPVRA